jgi:hypothetical protein
VLDETSSTRAQLKEDKIKRKIVKACLGRLRDAQGKPVVWCLGKRSKFRKRPCLFRSMENYRERETGLVSKVHRHGHIVRVLPSSTRHDTDREEGLAARLWFKNLA